MAERLRRRAATPSTQVRILSRTLSESEEKSYIVVLGRKNPLLAFLRAMPASYNWSLRLTCNQETGVRVLVPAQRQTGLWCSGLASLPLKQGTQVRVLVGLQTLSRGVMASAPDSDSGCPGSNPGGTTTKFFDVLCYLEPWCNSGVPRGSEKPEVSVRLRRAPQRLGVGP